MKVCGNCAARSLLIAELAGRIEVLRRQRRYVRSVLALEDRELAGAVGMPAAGIEPLDARQLLDARVKEAGVQALCACAPAYPSRLRDLPDRPAVIYWKGVESGLARHSGGAEMPAAVAVVGTRRASSEGIEIARSLGRGISAAGITVVSGMALGIDAAAHDGALAAGARTTAVLAGAPHVAYPRSKSSIHRELLERSLVVSETPPGSTPFAWNFLARNRIIAGLCQLTIVVEAAERSGSLVTAEMALDAGADVGAVPGSPLSWRAAGTNEMLRDGAVVVRGPEDVLQRLAELDLSPGPVQQLTLDGLSELATGVLADVQAGSRSVALLAGAHGGAGAVQAALTELELAGHLARLPGGRVLAH